MDLDVSRYGRVLGLNEHCTALRLGFVDAAVAAPSEQLGLSRLATVDGRLFPVIHRDVPLELLPDEQ